MLTPIKDPYPNDPCIQFPYKLKLFEGSTKGLVEKVKHKNGRHISQAQRRVAQSCTITVRKLKSVRSSVHHYRVPLKLNAKALPIITTCRNVHEQTVNTKDEPLY